MRSLTQSVSLPALGLLLFGGVASAQTAFPVPVTQTAMIQIDGPKKGANAGRYFNVEGKSHDKYMDYGVLRFETKGLKADLDKKFGAGKYKITGQEFFLQGHFKDNPVLPASIMLEALGQLAVLFLLEGMAVEPGKVVSPQTIFFTGCEGVRAHRVCKPGDILTLSIKPKRMKMPLATFEGAIRVGQEKAAIAEEITLTFGYADAVIQPDANSVASKPVTTAPNSEGGSTPPLRAAMGA